MIATNSKGFTLVELIITIAVISILAAILFATINPLKFVNLAQDSKILAYVRGGAAAVQSCLAYTDLNTEITNQAAQCGSIMKLTATCDASCVDAPGSPFVQNLPAELQFLTGANAVCVYALSNSRDNRYWVFKSTNGEFVNQVGTPSSCP